MKMKKQRLHDPSLKMSLALKVLVLFPHLVRESIPLNVTKDNGEEQYFIEWERSYLHSPRNRQQSGEHEGILGVSLAPLTQ